MAPPDQCIEAVVEPEHGVARLDPALGSGPICTIIQDVASLAIYFGLVTVLVV